MEVETLGVARSLGWKVHMRCANGYRLETRSMRKCIYRKQLDLETVAETMTTRPRSRLPGPLSISRVVEGEDRALPLELAALPWVAPRRDIAPVVWPTDVAFPINEHSVEMPGSPRVIIRAETVH
jgi:hypothetical protein